MKCLSDFTKGCENMHPVSSALLDWYDRNARVLPWRGIHDPYRTWVSEAMLQQTRVETVLPYYSRFLSRFPTIASLARADEADVLKMWEGLGYYSRARNLLNGARQVMRDFDGALPADPARLREISGIGPYMSGAIASIAFGIPVPAVDGNVIRVVSRLCCIREDVSVPAVRRQIESFASELVPPDRPGDHNQAMMDLGAGICVPGTPDCTRCPLSAFCKACAAGNAADLPVLPKARPQKVLPWTVVIIHADDRVLLRQRTEKLLQGLWCFPMIEGHLMPENAPQAVYDALGLSCREPLSHGNARHVFTHQVWDMNLISMHCPAVSPAPKGCEWIAVRDIKKNALPSAMNAAVRALDECLE